MELDEYRNSAYREHLQNTEFQKLLDMMQEDGEKATSELHAAVVVLEMLGMSYAADAIRLQAKELLDRWYKELAEEGGENNAG